MRRPPSTRKVPRDESRVGGQVDRYRGDVLRMVCAECGSPYSIDSGIYYRCSANINRGPAICPNGKYVRRDRVEEVVLQAVFEEVLSPDTVAYLSGKVNDALARLADRPSEVRQRLQAELDQARTKLENVKAAILDGIRTPTTRAMLEEWEGRVDRLEADLAITTKARGSVTLHPATIEGYLQDLRGTLATGTDHARMLLQRLVGKITLRRIANRLVAEIGGNLPGLIDLEDYGKFGAGGGT